MYVKNLQEVYKESIPSVGGKGANLGEMINAGFPVPPGFCVTSAAYDTYIQENCFTEDINAAIAFIRSEQDSKISLNLMDKIAAGELSKEMREEIEQAYKKMGNHVRVAVRSSATAEDLPEASFAGQQETYLNIQGIENVIHAIKRCFASLWTERAIAYRMKTGFDRQKVSLAVVVQEMIESNLSGVLFTVNPMNYAVEEMMINASYGLGEAIVSGQVTPDTFIWDKEKGVIKQKTLGSKEISVVYDNRGGTAKETNDNNVRSKYCMSGKQIQTLALLSQKIELHYGTPQDIEWAFSGNELYILQARGITTLGQKKQGEAATQKQNKRERMMMNNLIEHCPTPLYPLDFAPFQAVLHGKTETIEELGIKMTQSNALILKGTGEIEVHAPTIKMTPRALLIPFRIKQYKNFEENTSATEKVFGEVVPCLKRIETSDRSNLPMGELLKQLKQLMRLADKIIYIRFRYNIYPNYLVGRYLGSGLKRLTPPVSQYDIFSALHYKTWDMNVALSDLAAQVNQDKDLKEAIEKLSLDETLEEHLTDIAVRFPQFGSQYTQLLKEYGWKSTSTYSAFSASSWKEDKSYFLTLLRVTMARSGVMEESTKYKKICEQVRKTFSEQKSQKLQKAMDEMRSYHQNREESLYLLEWCYGLCRLIAKEIANRNKALIPSPEDVRFLTLEEVYSLSGTPKENFTEKISIRKQSMRENQALWNEMEVQSANIGKNMLKGVSGNVGKVRGKVCVIHDLSEFSKLQQGEILVCKYTDPVWTPLFLLAKAVVSDTGGPLSHSAIVAREYDIPAVLGCGNATKILADGQEIIVNGNEGIVQVVS